jgi:hypothetical protein
MRLSCLSSCHGTRCLFGMLGFTAVGHEWHCLERTEVVSLAYRGCQPLAREGSKLGTSGHGEIDDNGLLEVVDQLLGYIRLESRDLVCASTLFPSRIGTSLVCAALTISCHLANLHRRIHVVSVKMGMSMCHEVSDGVILLYK